MSLPSGILADYIHLVDIVVPEKQTGD
jgi:hypothetical protein